MSLAIVDIPDNCTECEFSKCRNIRYKDNDVSKPYWIFDFCDIFDTDLIDEKPCKKCLDAKENYLRVERLLKCRQ